MTTPDLTIVSLRYWPAYVRALELAAAALAETTPSGARAVRAAEEAVIRAVAADLWLVLVVRAAAELAAGRVALRTAARRGPGYGDARDLVRATEDLDTDGYALFARRWRAPRRGLQVQDVMGGWSAGEVWAALVWVEDYMADYAASLAA